MNNEQIKQKLLNSIEKEMGLMNNEQIKQKLLNSIEKEMERKELSQGEVARMIGLDRRNVNKILRGTERGVSIDQLVRIANGIGLDVDVIIKRSKD